MVTGSITSFFHPDSAPPSLKSKNRHLAVSSSTPTNTEISTCTPPPPIQTDRPPSSPASPTPAPAPPEPAQVDTASADVDPTQAEDSKTQEAKKDRAESEVSSPVYSVYNLVNDV